MSILTKPPSQKPEKGDKPGKAAKAPRKQKTAKGEAGQGGRRRAQVAHASVNLLSPWVLDEIRVRRLRARFLVGALVLALLIGAGWAVLRMNLASSESDLRGERAVADGLSAQIAQMTEVQRYVSDVTVRTDDVEETLAHEIAYADVLRALDDALPAGASYTSLTLSLAPEPDPSDPTAVEDAPVCPGPDPFGARVTVGCVTLSGSAANRDDVSALVQSLGDNGLFVEPFIATTINDDDDGIALDFEGTLGLDPTTFTHRYADVDGSETDQDQEPTR